MRLYFFMPHYVSNPFCTQCMYISNFLASFSQCENSDDHTLCDRAMLYPHFRFYFLDCDFFFLIQEKFTLVILIWIHCIWSSITERESVMPSCAYPGFMGILLCGFLCLYLLSVLQWHQDHKVNQSFSCPCQCMIYLTYCLVLHPHSYNPKIINITLLKYG